MAKKKTAHEDPPVVLAPQEEAPATEKVSKMEAVRRILADDSEMKPADGVAAVKARYGIEMSTSNFSAYKSQIRAKGKEPGTSRKPKGRHTGITGGGSFGADPLEAAEAVKDLVDRFGAKTVKGLADLFEG